MPNSDFTSTLDSRDYIKVMNALSDLSKIEKEAVVAKAISEGLSLIVQEGKKNLQQSSTKVRTGNLSHSFKTLTSKKELKGYGGFRRPQGAHAHLIDRGTVVRKNRKGQNRGKVTGNLFWTKAVQMVGPRAQSELMESVRKSIENIMKRNSR